MANLLIVDDEDMVRMTLRQILEKAGHSVVEAIDGQDALRVFGDNKIDLVITDIVMPNMDGIEAIMALRDEQPFLKIIAISGGGRTKNMDFLELAKEIGAKEILAKPFEKSQVIETVNKILNLNG